MSGGLPAGGLALLGLGGAFFLGAKNNPFSLLFTLGGFIALLLLAQAVASRPELTESSCVSISRSWSRSAWAAAIWRWRLFGRFSPGPSMSRAWASPLTRQAI